MTGVREGRRERGEEGGQTDANEHAAMFMIEGEQADEKADGREHGHENLFKRKGRSGLLSKGLGCRSVTVS